MCQTTPFQTVAFVIKSQYFLPLPFDATMMFTHIFIVMSVDTRTAPWIIYFECTCISCCTLGDCSENAGSTSPVVYICNYYIYIIHAHIFTFFHLHLYFNIRKQYFLRGSQRYLPFSVIIITVYA